MSKRKLGLGLFTAGLLTLGTTTPVCADYTTVNGGTTSVNEYIVMDKSANVPNVTSTFTVTAGTPIQSDGTATLPIYAGVDADKVTASKITFKAGNTTYETVQGDDIGVTLDGTQKYAKGTSTIDFSHVGFTAPGVYRYVLTKSTSAQGLTAATDATRLIDVYVIDDNGSLEVGGYILHNGDDGTATALRTKTDPDTKNTGYQDTYTTNDLTFSKTVSGNQASRNKYFKFTVNLTGGAKGTVYTVDLANAEGTVDDHTNPTTLTAGEDGAVSQDFYLKHGQSITIQGLTESTGYTISEDATAVDADGYDPSATITGDTTTGDTNETIAMDSTAYTVTDTAMTADTTVAYTNTREGTIPTGIIMAVAPYAAAVVLGGAGLAGGVTFVMKKKKEDSEEE